MSEGKNCTHRCPPSSRRLPCHRSRRRSWPRPPREASTRAGKRRRCFRHRRRTPGPTWPHRRVSSFPKVYVLHQEGRRASRSVLGSWLGVSKIAFQKVSYGVRHLDPPPCTARLDVGVKLCGDVDGEAFHGSRHSELRGRLAHHQGWLRLLPCTVFHHLRFYGKPRLASRHAGARARVNGTGSGSGPPGRSRRTGGRGTWR